jgi:hypothetical protein
MALVDNPTLQCPYLQMTVEVRRSRSLRIGGALLRLLCENSQSLRLKLRTTLMLEREEPGGS